MGEPVQSARVLTVRTLSPGVRELTLRPETEPLRFKPGQWVSLQIPLEGPRPLVRAYSMAEPESPSGHVVLAFDRVPQGRGTGYLFALKEGDEVLFSGPYGRFVSPESGPNDLLFIARYTGIVPIRCIIMHLASAPAVSSMTLAYCAPGQSELIYDEEFTRLASQTNFRYLTVTNESARELEKPVSEWAVMKTLGPYISGRTKFIPMISGIKAFVRPLRAYFLETGFDRREIRVETFD